MHSLNSSQNSIGKIMILFIFIFFSSTNAFWGYEIYMTSDIVPVLSCGIPVFLLMVLFWAGQVKVRLKTLILTVLIYSIMALSSGFNAKYMIYYGLCAVLLLYSEISETQGMLKLFFIFGIIFSIGTLFNLLFRGTYQSLILPSFKISSQYFRLQIWSARGTTFPGFTNQTAYNAGFLIYGIGYLVCNYSVKKQNKLLFYIILAVFILSLILTNKRAHFVFLFIALIITYFFSDERSSRTNRLIKIAVISFGIIALLWWSVTYFDVGVLSKLANTLKLLTSDDDISSGRIRLYSRAIELFTRHPLFGIGWGTFQRSTINSQGVHTAVHNVYLQLLCETGIVGFSVYITFFIYAFTTAIKVSRYNLEERDKISVRFNLFLQAFFLLYCFTGNPLYDVPYYVPYYLSCSYLFSFNHKYLHSKNGCQINHTARIKT